VGEEETVVDTLTFQHHFTDRLERYTPHGVNSHTIRAPKLKALPPVQYQVQHSQTMPTLHPVDSRYWSEVTSRLSDSNYSSDLASRRSISGSNSLKQEVRGGVSTEDSSARVEQVGSTAVEPAAVEPAAVVAEPANVAAEHAVEPPAAIAAEPVAVAAELATAATGPTAVKNVIQTPPEPGELSEPSLTLDTWISSEFSEGDGAVLPATDISIPAWAQEVLDTDPALEEVRTEEVQTTFILPGHRTFLKREARRCAQAAATAAVHACAMSTAVAEVALKRTATQQSPKASAKEEAKQAKHDASEAAKKAKHVKSESAKKEKQEAKEEKEKSKNEKSETAKRAKQEAKEEKEKSKNEKSETAKRAKQEAKEEKEKAKRQKSEAAKKAKQGANQEKEKRAPNAAENQVETMEVGVEKEEVGKEVKEVGKEEGKEEKEELKEEVKELSEYDQQKLAEVEGQRIANEENARARAKEYKQALQEEKELREEEELLDKQAALLIERCGLAAKEEDAKREAEECVRKQAEERENKKVEERAAKQAEARAATKAAAKAAEKEAIKHRLNQIEQESARQKRLEIQARQHEKAAISRRLERMQEVSAAQEAEETRRVEVEKAKATRERLARREKRAQDKRRAQKMTADQLQAEMEHARAKRDTEEQVRQLKAKIEADKLRQQQAREKVREDRVKQEAFEEDEVEAKREAEEQQVRDEEERKETEKLVKMMEELEKMRRRSIDRMKFDLQEKKKIEELTKAAGPAELAAYKELILMAMADGNLAPAEEERLVNARHKYRVTDGQHQQLLQEAKWFAGWSSVASMQEDSSQRIQDVAAERYHNDLRRQFTERRQMWKQDSRQNEKAVVELHGSGLGGVAKTSAQRALVSRVLLLQCWEGGDPQRVKELLQQGVDPDYEGVITGAALEHMIASTPPSTPSGPPNSSRQHKQVQAALGLLTATPLQQACWQGHARCAKLLLGAGANPDKQTQMGDTPLMGTLYHRKSGNSSGGDSDDSGWKATAALLLKSGADTRRRNNVGETALMYCCCAGPLESESVSRRSAEALLWLIEQLKARDNSAALVVAGLDGDGDSEAGGDSTDCGTLMGELLAQNMDGRTALHMACAAADYECVDTLLTTAVAVAATASAKMPLPVTMLSTHDTARAAGSTTKGATPLMEACYLGSTKCVRRMLQALTEEDDAAAMMAGTAEGASSAENRSSYQTTVVNLTNGQGESALMWAVERGHSDCVSLLIAAGALIDAPTSGGSTALIWACAGAEAELAKGYSTCAQLLIEAGALPDAATATGLTGLMWASFRGHDECVRLLLLGTADTPAASVDARNQEGATALVLACQAGQVQCVRQLLKAGADTQLATSANLTAQVVATAQGHIECADLIALVPVKPKQVPATAAALEHYGLLLEMALDDGVLAEVEDGRLEEARQKHNITDKQHQQLLHDVRKVAAREAQLAALEQYNFLLEMALNDGVLAETEKGRLEAARQKYEITDEQHHQLLRKVREEAAREAQLNLIREDSPSEESEEYRAQVTEIYREHNPEKLENPVFVANALRKYAGREEELMAALRRLFNITD
jgi:ankyrin repeat protein